MPEMVTQKESRDYQVKGVEEKSPEQRLIELLEEKVEMLEKENALLREGYGDKSNKPPIAMKTKERIRTTSRLSQLLEAKSLKNKQDLDAKIADKS